MPANPLVTPSGSTGVPHPQWASAMVMRPEVDPAQRLLAIRNRFVNVVLIGFAVISLSGLILLLLRARNIGWHGSSTLQVAVALLCFFLFFTRKPLDYTYKPASFWPWERGFSRRIAIFFTERDM